MKDLERQAEAALSGARRALTPSARSRHNVRAALAASVATFAAEAGSASAAQVGNGGAMAGATGGAPGVPSVAAAGSAGASAAPGAGAAVAVGAKALLAASIGKTVAVIAAVGGISAGVAWVSHDAAPHRSQPEDREQAVSAGAPAPPTERAASPDPDNASPDEVGRSARRASAADTAASGATEETARQRDASVPQVGTSKAASARDALEEEIALLKRAQRAAQQDQPTLALALLAELDARFGRGGLWQEREVTRVLALCSAGRVADARRTARQFSSANPKTLYVERISKSCAGGVSEPPSIPKGKSPVAKFGDAGD